VARHFLDRHRRAPGRLSRRQPACPESGGADFLANPVVREIPIDSHIARIYAEIVTSLKRAGTPLPTNDIWIAAAAARAGATLVTYDTHFAAVERIGSLVLEASRQ